MLKGHLDNRAECRLTVWSAGSTAALTLSVLPLLAFAFERGEVELCAVIVRDCAGPADDRQRVRDPSSGRMDSFVEFEIIRLRCVPRGGGIARMRVELSTTRRPLLLEEIGPVNRVWRMLSSPRLIEPRVGTRSASSAALAAAEHGVALEVCEDRTSAQFGSVVALFAERAGGLRLRAGPVGVSRRRAEMVDCQAGTNLVAEINGGAPVGRDVGDELRPFAALMEVPSLLRILHSTGYVNSALRLARMFVRPEGTLKNRKRLPRCAGLRSYSVQRRSAPHLARERARW